MNTRIVMAVSVVLMLLGLLFGCDFMVAGVARPGDMISDGPDFLSGRRNVLLIIADDMGVDKVGIYNEGVRIGDGCSLNDGVVVDELSNSVPETVTIDSLACAGVLFTNAWSNPVCSPTRAGIYTGRHAFRHGVGKAIGLPTTVSHLDVKYDTLPEILSDAAYKSGLFGKWHLGAICPTTDYGWDRHYGILEGEVLDYCDWTKLRDCSPAPSRSTGYATHDNVDDAVEWIGLAGNDTRWFAVLAFNTPHTPLQQYFPGREACGPEVSPDDPPSAQLGAYHSMIKTMDIAIGDLLNRIDADVLEKTTIIFVGDNGTQGGGYDIIEEPFIKDRAKGSVYEGGVNVPFIVADGYALVHPGTPSPISTGRVASPGRVEDALVHTVDIFATVAEIAGVDGSTGCDSVSFVPYLTQLEADHVRDFVYTETFSTAADGSHTGINVAIRDAQYKLVYKDSGVLELYDLDANPWEVKADALDLTTYNAQLESLIGAVFRMGGCP